MTETRSQPHKGNTMVGLNLWDAGGAAAIELDGVHGRVGPHNDMFVSRSKAFPVQRSMRKSNCTLGDHYRAMETARRKGSRSSAIRSWLVRWQR